MNTHLPSERYECLKAPTVIDTLKCFPRVLQLCIVLCPYIYSPITTAILPETDLRELHRQGELLPLTRAHHVTKPDLNSTNFRTFNMDHKCPGLQVTTIL